MVAAFTAVKGLSISAVMFAMTDDNRMLRMCNIERI